jgi:nucleoside phosphorylase
MATTIEPHKQVCSLLLFVATPTEEAALKAAATERMLSFEKIKHPKLGEYHWLGQVGDETVIATCPVRESGKLVMGALGRLGSAARGIRFSEATGATKIVQLGMAFGIDRVRQKLGDVLVSASLVPYDNRDVRAATGGSAAYATDYSAAKPESARRDLVELFRRELARRPAGGPAVHIGALLSGAARIHSRAFRDELVAGVPGGGDPIVGGEMEGVGLLAASVSRDDPIWCVVKGISDFADEDRDSDIAVGRELACRNAAEFVLSALVNDAGGE